MTALDADAVIADFESLPAPRGEPFSGGSQFDRQLLERALRGSRRLLERIPDQRRRYGWAAEPDAFGSGIEAWLQYELLRALDNGVSFRDPMPVAIRVVSGLADEIATRAGASCRFVLVSADLVDALASLWREMGRIGQAAPKHYSGADRWCNTNLFGGGQLEALARDQLPLAYMHIVSFLNWKGAYSACDLGDPDDWLPGERNRSWPGWMPTPSPRGLLERIPLAADALGLQRRATPSQLQVERLFRAPLRFLAFHEMGQTDARIGLEGETRQPAHWAGLADVFALIALTRNVEPSRPKDPATLHAASETAIGMGVALQLMRMNRVRNGSAEAIERLCLPGRHRDPPRVRRLGRIEAQWRCMNAIGLVLSSRGERAARSLNFALAEMQVLFGLTAAVQLATLGAQVFLGDLCSFSWDELAAHYEQEFKRLEREEPEA